MLQFSLQGVEPSLQQRVLVGVVRVKSRTADVGAFADILDGDVVPAALGKELDERVAQGIARAHAAAIDGLIDQLAVHRQS